MRLGEALSGPGVDRGDRGEGAHHWPRFLETERRWWPAASRCSSTVFAKWSERRGLIMVLPGALLRWGNPPTAGRPRARAAQRMRGGASPPRGADTPTLGDADPPHRWRPARSATPGLVIVEWTASRAAGAIRRPTSRRCTSTTPTTRRGTSSRARSPSASATRSCSPRPAPARPPRAASPTPTGTRGRSRRATCWRWGRRSRR